MNLKSQISFPHTQKSKCVIALLLCGYLSFIIIFLEPFDTDQFQADYRLPLLLGYGLLAGLAFLIQGRVENVWYQKSAKIWKVKHEAVSTVVFMLFSANVLYLYNTLAVNARSPSIGSYLHFMFITVAAMIPVFVPPMLYLRRQFGEKQVPLPDHLVLLSGENKKENLKVEKDALLYVKAVENYVEICFIEKDGKLASKTFRQTLSSICRQAPFLEKCHRSYLVSKTAIKDIKGNSQSAKITFMATDSEIPLSKTYYKSIREGLK